MSSTVVSPVAVLLLDLNRSDSAIRAVCSVLESDPPPGKVLVLCNGSRREHREALTAAFAGSQQVSVFTSDSNLGFTGGMNHLFAGLLEQGNPPPLMLLLNNDATVEPSAIARLTEAVLGDERIGIAGPRILRAGSARIIDDDGAIVIPWLMQQRFRGAGRKEPGAPDTVREVPFVSGACMMIRTDLFRALGGFDKRFFAYFEDWDLCLRAARLGFTCRHVPHAIAWHDTDKGRGRRSRFFQFMMTRNRCLMAQTHLPPAVRLLVFLPYFIAVRVLFNLLRLFATGNFEGARGVLLGLLWLAAPASMRERLHPEP